MARKLRLDKRFIFVTVIVTLLVIVLTGCETKEKTSSSKERSTSEVNAQNPSSALPPQTTTTTTRVAALETTNKTNYTFAEIADLDGNRDGFSQREIDVSEGVVIAHDSFPYEMNGLEYVPFNLFAVYPKDEFDRHFTHNEPIREDRIIYALSCEFSSLKIRAGDVISVHGVLDQLKLVRAIEDYVTDKESVVASLPIKPPTFIKDPPLYVNWERYSDDRNTIAQLEKHIFSLRENDPIVKKAQEICRIATENEVRKAQNAIDRKLRYQ